jgi:hypothetical protein
MHPTTNGMTLAYCAILQSLIDTLIDKNVLSVEEVRAVFSSAAEMLAPNIRRPTVREALDIIHAIPKR